MIVSGRTADDLGGITKSGEIRIAEFDQETGIITFEGSPIQGTGAFTLTLKKELGVPEYVHFRTPVLQKYRRYRVKWRFIMPEQDASGVPLLVQKLPIVSGARVPFIQSYAPRRGPH